MNNLDTSPIRRMFSLSAFFGEVDVVVEAMADVVSIKEIGFVSF
jgi:hypothetical protein